MIQRLQSSLGRHIHSHIVLLVGASKLRALDKVSGALPYLTVAAAAVVPFYPARLFCCCCCKISIIKVRTARITIAVRRFIATLFFWFLCTFSPPFPPKQTVSQSPAVVGQCPIASSVLRDSEALSPFHSPRDGCVTQQCVWGRSYVSRSRCHRMGPTKKEARRKEKTCETTLLLLPVLVVAITRVHALVS